MTASRSLTKPRPRSATSGPRPRPLVVDVYATLLGLGLGISAALALSVESRSLLSGPGGLYDAVGRLAAMTGSYLLLVMVLLMSRLPALERALGQDRLTRWHRRVAPWPLGLILAHVLFVTLGYAAAAHTGVVSQFITLLSSYRYVVYAGAGLAIMLIATFASIAAIRRLMRYERWWAVHLTLYVALALSLPHQLTTGLMFIGHPLARLFWTALWAGSAAAVIYARLGVPLVRNLRHRLVVHHVESLSPDVVAITLTGQHLERLGASGGQFFQWRFLASGLWLHAHPYSLSALPRPPYLRLTVKAAGDHSAALSALAPGTRVLIEGPYGALTHHHRVTRAVTLVGAGVGITPLRAILDDMPTHVPVTMLVRARNADDIIHADELAALLKRRGGRYVPLIGSRHDIDLSPRGLATIVPNIIDSDLYVCGPPAFADVVLESAARLGLDPEQLHYEAFSF